MIVGGEKETLLLLIPEEVDLFFREFGSGSEPLFVSGRLVESDEAMRQESVVVEISIELGDSVSVSAL